MYLIGKNQNKKSSPLFIACLVLLAFLVVILVYVSIFQSLDFGLSLNTFSAEEEARKELVTNADNVFVGRVVEQVGYKLLLPSPQGRIVTPHGQFLVKIEENIKGDLSGMVVVNQSGRYYSTDLVPLIEVQKEDQLLIVGKTYLFVTQMNAEHNWHDIVRDEVISGYAHILIEDDLHRKQLIEAFKRYIR